MHQHFIAPWLPWLKVAPSDYTAKQCVCVCVWVCARARVCVCFHVHFSGDEAVPVPAVVCLGEPTDFISCRQK